MLVWPASVQPLFIGGTLLWSGGLKCFGRSARHSAERSALASLVGEKRALPAYRLTGAVELALAIVLLVPPVFAAESATAAVLGVGFLAYLAYARIAAPDSSCGCLSKKRTPVTWRSFARAGLILVAALVGTQASVWWGRGLADRPLTAVLVVAEVALLVALSPEGDRLWLMPLRRARIRRKHPLSDHSFEMPLESSLQQLLASPAYLQVSPLLKSGLRETWDEEDMRVLVYTAEFEGTVTTAVFAVPLRHYRPEDVRVALVDEATESTLLASA